MRRGLLVLAALPVLLQVGCVGFRFEEERIGRPDMIEKVPSLEIGKSTLVETLERVGPPDMLIRVGNVDRAYYITWKGTFFKFVLKVNIPGLGRSVSVDVFILTIGSEELRYARLDYDKAGVLQKLHVDTIVYDAGSEAYVMDDSIVSRFMVRRDRVLSVAERRKQEREKKRKD